MSSLFAVCYFHSPGGSTCMCELTLQQLSARNDVMAIVLKLMSNRKSDCIFMWSTVRVHSCQISSQSDL